MDLKMPIPEQTHLGLRAMKTVALADGVLDEAERQMLASVQTILGTNYAVDELAPITAQELAPALPDPQIRHQLVQGLIVVSLIDGKANARETEAVEQFARALGVDVPEVRDLRSLFNGEMLRLRLDLGRRFWLREKVKEIWKAERFRGLVKFVRGMVGRYEDAELARRYHALEHYPSGSLGRAYWEYCRSNGFPCPARRPAPQNRSCSMIARMSCPDTGHHRIRRCRWPASAPDSNAVIRGHSSSSCCCNSMSASA
jgi:tellurite resistance protein